MSFLADRLKAIKPSASMAVVQKAFDLANTGRDIISLGAGEPDFDTPLHIIEAGKKALDEGVTRYTGVNGTPELQAALTAKFKRDNDLDFT